MADLTFQMPDGSSRTATVDDGFKNLSTSDQLAFVDRMRQSATGSPAAQPSSSFSDDLKAGAGGAMSSLGSLTSGLGSVSDTAGLPAGVGDTLRSGGSWLQDNAPKAPAGYHNRGGDIVSDLGQGNFSRAAGDVAHGVVSGLPTMGAAMAGGAVGGPVGAAAVAGALGEGQAAGERAQSAGRSTPSSEDMLRSLPRAAGDAAASALPFGKFGGSTARRLALASGGAGAQSALDQYDSTGSVDPSQVGNAAITGGATMGAGEAAGAVQGGIKSAADSLMSRRYSPNTPEEAKSWVRVGQDMNERAQTATNAGPANTPFEIANSLKRDYDARVAQTILAAKSQGASRDALTTMNAAYSQALRHNNTLADDPGSSFGQLDGLDHGLSDSQLAKFKEDLLDLNTVSRQSFRNQGTGPLQAAGGFAGKVIAPAAEVLSGNPMGLAAAIAGHGSGIQEKIGAGLGAASDRLLGTNTPPIVLQRIAAQRALSRMGIDPDSIRSPAGVAPAAPEAPPQTPVGPYGPQTTASKPAVSLMNKVRSQAQDSMDAANAPGPVPGFVRPAQPTPGPVPGFVRPAQPTPGPVPGFVRPAPGAVPPPIPSRPATGLMEQMKARAQAQMDAEDQPDPDTGNRPDPVPVNTPLPAKTRTPPAQTPPSTLSPDTPQTVRDAVADDPTMAAQVAAAQAQAPRGGHPSHASAYLAQGLPGNPSPPQLLARVKAAEDGGAVAPGTTEWLKTTPTGMDRAVATKLRQDLLSFETAPGVDPETGGVKGVVNPLAYAHNLQQEGDAYASVPPDLTPLADHLRNPDVNGKTKAGRRLALAQLLAADPANAARLQAHLGPLTGYGQGK